MSFIKRVIEEIGVVQIKQASGVNQKTPLISTSAASTGWTEKVDTDATSKDSFFIVVFLIIFTIWQVEKSLNSFIPTPSGILS